jgi:hypothetical protein
VVLQVAALIAFAFLVLGLLANGELLEYRSIYEEVEFNPAEVEDKCASESGRCAWWPSDEPDPAKRLRECIECETRPRAVGEQLVGIDSEDAASVAILLMMALTMSFAVVRVPTWLWEGWHKDR